MGPEGVNIQLLHRDELTGAQEPPQEPKLDELRPGQKISLQGMSLVGQVGRSIFQG